MERCHGRADLWLGRNSSRAAPDKGVPPRRGPPGCLGRLAWEAQACLPEPLPGSSSTVSPRRPGGGRPTLQGLSADGRAGAGSSLYPAMAWSAFFSPAEPAPLDCPFRRAALPEEKPACSRRWWTLPWGLVRTVCAGAHLALRWAAPHRRRRTSPSPPRRGRKPNRRRWFPRSPGLQTVPDFRVAELGRSGTRARRGWVSAFGLDDEGTASRMRR